MIQPEPLISLHLNVHYPGKSDVLHDVSLDINRGEVLGLVGESGCGKSTLALAILKLLHLKRAQSTGVIHFNGRDLMQMPEAEMRHLRGKEIGLVLQSPMSALNPALRIRTQLSEAWRVHVRASRAECEHAIRQVLEDVSLPISDEFLLRYPSQLSVGQAQRVLIAMAVLHRPLLLLADEPTSALDIITQSEILDLFVTLSRRLGTSVLYISHDLLSVAAISQRVAVMQNGTILECRRTTDIFRNPKHPYTRELLRSLPMPPMFAMSHFAR